MIALKYLLEFLGVALIAAAAAARTTTLAAGRPACRLGRGSDAGEFQPSASGREELLPPVVASSFHELTPNYLVRDLFATKRAEIRREAAGAITRKLAPDGVIVKEIMLPYNCQRNMREAWRACC